ncbi:hypothetical protein HYH03_018229 [Edaphochlamys debaryana]|uniref:EF-hand domain-containing protein n=1 Tax=Edaphochlamys debaryana TaxID=47281 RepID=A0A835XIF0_9CHLO|nr:hypothetical protein HYH03_018229 [Edaphochlamys debaryana]|eukprot:KAG2482886.1 hypothetical protein HYH03_018229 [Edaphochlamys debaryana]
MATDNQSSTQGVRDALAQHIRDIIGGVAAHHLEDAREMMADMDANGDGTLTFEEWATAFDGSKAELDSYRQLFSLLDADGSGALSVDELAVLATLVEGCPFACDRCEALTLGPQLMGCRRCWRQGLVDGDLEEAGRAVAFCTSCCDPAAAGGCGSRGGCCPNCDRALEAVDNTWWLPLRDWPAMQEILSEEDYRRVRVMDARKALLALAEEAVDEAGLNIEGVELSREDVVRGFTGEEGACSRIGEKQASTLFQCFDLDNSGVLSGTELLAVAATDRCSPYGCDGACSTLVFDDTLFTCKACWREHQRTGFADPKLAVCYCVSCVRRSARATGAEPTCHNCKGSLQAVPNEWWKDAHEDWSTMRELRAEGEAAVAPSSAPATSPEAAEAAARQEQGDAAGPQGQGHEAPRPSMRRQRSQAVGRKVGESAARLGGTDASGSTVQGRAAQEGALPTVASLQREVVTAC